MEHRRKPMAPRKCKQDLRLAEQVEDPKAFKRGWTHSFRSTEVSSDSADSRPQERDGNTQARDDQLKDVVEQAGAN